MSIVEVKNTALLVFAGIGAFLAKMVGGWDAALKALIIIMAVDYITGLIVAGVFRSSNKSATGALDSRAGFKGLIKKCMILLMVIIGTVLDLCVGTDSLVRTAVILFYMGNEGLSIIENFGLMGMPVPKKLREAFEVLKKKGDEDSESLH